jgi:DNA repair protein RadC
VLVDPKVVFSIALRYQATGIILIHNHPSGALKPSQQDINLTKRISEAGRVLDISVNDHLIITDTQYYSFADNGIF